MTNLTAASVALAVALAVDLTPRPAPVPAPAPGVHEKKETRCGACHTAEGWDRVAFDHARTGFALEGAHRTAPCRGCHVATDLKLAVPRACVACHRDVHGGRLGARCGDCHDAVAWKEHVFGPEAHRRTNFPLDGRHAVLPCEECHGDRRDRGFSRPTRTCAQCHEGDLARAAAGFFDHTALGLTGDCRRCHGAWDFRDALLPGHDTCFPIRSGRHSGIRCMRCHTSLAAADFQSPGSCSTGTAACTRCHGTCPEDHNSCPISDARCLECHPRGSAEGD